MFPSRTALFHLLGNLSSVFTSVCFPAGCRICDRLLTHARRLPLCEECLSSFQKIPPGYCDLCGEPGAFDPEFPKETSHCPDCQQRRFAFDLARSYGLYEGTLVRAILLLKHEQIKPLGNWFADRLSELVRKEGARMLADAIVPVPLHRQRSQERGFNQVDLIGRPMSKKLNLPYLPVLLMRLRPRPEKHLLRREERWEVVRGAFAIRKGSRVDNLRILLLDDVMTTGATLDACSGELRGAGAKSVMGVARAGRPLISSFAETPVARRDGR
jgi:competence protein ComFC